MKELLSANQIEYTYVEIMDSIKNLREFLKLRDTRAEYAQIKELGFVGIPSLVIDNDVYVKPDQALIEKLGQK